MIQLVSSLEADTQQQFMFRLENIRVTSQQDPFGMEKKNCLVKVHCFFTTLELSIFTKMATAIPDGIWIYLYPGMKSYPHVFVSRWGSVALKQCEYFRSTNQESPRGSSPGALFINSRPLRASGRRPPGPPACRRGSCSISRTCSGAATGRPAPDCSGPVHSESPLRPGPG